jgi:hypothetical protein
MLTLVGELNGWAPNWWPCINFWNFLAIKEMLIKNSNPLFQHK